MLVAAVSAQAKLRVVATLPDFSALAQAVGGAQVDVECLARGTEDPHFVDARPSFIRVLNRADVLLEGGAQLEIGWLPPLVNNARNRKILAGSPGDVLMSEGVELLDVPSAPIDRSMGDVHPAGNPHYWLDPANGVIMARHLAAVFSREDPDHAAEYGSNLRAFETKMQSKLAEWERRMKPFQGTKVITYHKTYDYLARRFGLNIVTQIEPKPGIEPSPSHIADLVGRWKGQGVKLILAEPNRPRRTGQYVADQLEAKLVILPGMVGGDRAVKDYFDLFDFDLGKIEEALKAP